MISSVVFLAIFSGYEESKEISRRHLIPREDTESPVWFLTSPLGLARTKPSLLARTVGLNICGLGLPHRRNPSSPALRELPLPWQPFLLSLSPPFFRPCSPPLAVTAAAAILPRFSGLSRHHVSGRRS